MNRIQIVQVDNPHKFWYKNCNDLVENQRLEELEDNLKNQVTDLLEWQEHQQPINRGDEVVAYHAGWDKWIRGKAGKLKTGSKADMGPSIEIWAIDYGCKLVIPLKDVHFLEDKTLACKGPINVHIGGLSGIVPAKVVSFEFISFCAFGKKIQLIKNNLLIYRNRSSILIH